jgi:hypothetical protein
VFDEPKKPLADLFPGVSRRWDDGWVALTLSVSGSDGRVKLDLTPSAPLSDADAKAWTRAAARTATSGSRVDRAGVDLLHAAAIASRLRSVAPRTRTAQQATRSHEVLPLHYFILRETVAAKATQHPRARQARTFTVLPTKSGFTISYIPVSKMVLVALLRELGLEKFAGDGRSADHDRLWAKYFNLNAVETKERRFAGSIVTDGVGASLLLTRPQGQGSLRCADELPSLSDLPDGTLVTGVDGGFTDVVTCASYEVATDERTGDKTLVPYCADRGSAVATPVVTPAALASPVSRCCCSTCDGRRTRPECRSYSSGAYYAASKVEESRRRTTHLNRATKALVDGMPSAAVPDVEGQRQHLRAYLSALPELLAHRARHAYRNLRFKRFVYRQKAIGEICAVVAPEGRTSVIGFGDWTGGRASPISRRAAGPLRDVKQQLRMLGRVRACRDIRETRTSKTCSACHCELENMKARSVRWVRRPEVDAARTDEVRGARRSTAQRLEKVRRSGRAPTRGRRWEKEEKATGKVHKVLHCRNSAGCRRTAAAGAPTWDRDVNASLNITMLTICEMAGLARPGAFLPRRRRMGAT